MILGSLIGVYRGLVAVSEAVAADLVQAVDRALDRFAGGPAVSEEMAAMLAVAAIGPLTVEAPTIDADMLHHGCWTLHVCAVNHTVSVVRPDDTCPICDPSPAASPAGDRPAAESDGQLPTAPAAGHPNPRHDAAKAGARITKWLNESFAKHRR